MSDANGKIHVDMHRWLDLLEIRIKIEDHRFFKLMDSCLKFRLRKNDLSEVFVKKNGIRCKEKTKVIE